MLSLDAHALDPRGGARPPPYMPTGKLQSQHRKWERALTLLSYIYTVLARNMRTREHRGIHGTRRSHARICVQIGPRTHAPFVTTDCHSIHPIPSGMPMPEHNTRLLHAHHITRTTRKLGTNVCRAGLCWGARSYETKQLIAIQSTRYPQARLVALRVELLARLPPPQAPSLTGLRATHSCHKKCLRPESPLSPDMVRPSLGRAWTREKVTTNISPAHRLRRPRRHPCRSP